MDQTLGWIHDALVYDNGAAQPYFSVGPFSNHVRDRDGGHDPRARRGRRRRLDACPGDGCGSGTGPGGRGCRCGARNRSARIGGPVGRGGPGGGRIPQARLLAAVRAALARGGMPGRGGRDRLPPRRPAHRRSSGLGRRRRLPGGHHGRRERLGGLARRPPFDRGRARDPGHRLLRRPDSGARALPVPVLRRGRDPAGRVVALERRVRRAGRGQRREPAGRPGRIPGHPRRAGCRWDGRPDLGAARRLGQLPQDRRVGRDHLADRAFGRRHRPRPAVGPGADATPGRRGAGLGGRKGGPRARARALVGPDTDVAAGRRGPAWAAEGSGLEPEPSSPRS